MFQENKRYHFLHRSHQAHERHLRVNHQICLLCFSDIQQHQDVRHYILQQNVLCGDCLRQLKRVNIKTKLEECPLHILYEYNEFLESLLFQFKEGRDIALYPVFFHEDIKKINDKFRHYAVILMPSGREKMMERKFMPLREMLKGCTLEIIEPFYKSKDVKQSLQSFENRANISQVIKLREDIRLPKKKLLLVDDVCTSGSTLKCAYDLLKTHTYKIEALVLCAHPIFVESCDKKGLLRKGRFSIL